MLVGSCVPGTERGSLYVTAAQRARCGDRGWLLCCLLVGAVLARAAYMAQPTRLATFIYRRLAVPPGPEQSVRVAMPCETGLGLRERICAAVDEGLPVLIDFHRCDVETSDLAGRRTHYPCCTLLLQLLALAPRAGSDR